MLSFLFLHYHYVFSFYFLFIYILSFLHLLRARVDRSALRIGKRLNVVFWDIAPCSPYGKRRFGRTFQGKYHPSKKPTCSGVRGGYLSLACLKFMASNASCVLHCDSYCENKHIFMTAITPLHATDRVN
jgi:hypothetical protein